MPTFIYQSAKVNYTDTGFGNVVLLVHGFGEDSTIWHAQKDFLQQHYRLIIPDVPGSGLSDLIEKDNVTIDDYTDCLYALLQHLQLPQTQRISVFGHSMGGYIALAFAKKYSYALQAFGLIHSTAFADSEEKKQVRLRGIETMQQYGAYAFLKTTIPNLFGNSFKQKSPQVVDALIEKGKNFSVAALQQYYKAMMLRSDTTEVLVKSTVPVLFVIGTEDVAAPINDVLKQVHLPAISKIKNLENVGHMGMLEATDEVNETMLSFLQNIGC